MSRTFAAILVCLTLAVSLAAVVLSNTVSNRTSRGPRVRPSAVLAETFTEVLCRVPSDVETVRWDSRPFEKPMLIDALRPTEEGRRVQEIREAYAEVLRRPAVPDDCNQVRQWIDGNLTLDQVTRELRDLPEGRRVAQVRGVFVETLGRDPREWDDLSLRRWVDSPYAIAEIRSRLVAQRPLTGVHYFTWYRPQPGGGWGNDLTAVPGDSPMPALGWYDSGDTDIMARQISEIEEAGFDFVIVHIVVGPNRTWSYARTFVDRLSGHRLHAAIMLDGLYADDAPTKAMWVERVKREFTTDVHYQYLDGQPLVMLFSAALNFDVPGVTLRNVYWTEHYESGRNMIRPSLRLDPTDWPFWAPSPQPLINGIVPVLPGYTDAALGRERAMVHPRDGGRLYREQWQRALALHPELILVYSWNEYFERSAIEPTDAWGNLYLDLSACYIRHAHRGTVGGC